MTPERPRGNSMKLRIDTDFGEVVEIGLLSEIFAAVRAGS